jgi:HK97 family phage major capsid protein
MIDKHDLHARLGEITDELATLAGYSRPSNAQTERARELTDELVEVRAQLADSETRRAAIRAAYNATPASKRVAGTSFGVISKPSHDELFRGGRGTTDDALRALDVALEDAVTITGRSADAVPAMRGIIEMNPTVGDYIRAAANPSYRSAFGKLVSAGDPSIALMKMNDSERAAFAAVAEAEERTALYSGATTGSYAVPLLLDQTIIPTSNGAANPFRQIARTVTGISKTWTGISSGGIDASWDSEGVQVSDDTPTLAQPQVVSHKASAFVNFSVEIEGDWNGMAAEMSMLFADAKDALEATAFSTGSGSEQPYGILTDLFAASGTVGVLPTTDGQFGAVDVRALFGALPPRYRPNSSWLASIDVQNDIRSFDTATGVMAAQTVDLTAPYNFNLLGRPVYEASGFPNFTGTTGASNILVVGDFRNYVLFDRVGSRVELVPHIMGANGRPNGTRGLYYWWRVGGKTVNTNAFRLLLNA